MKNPAKKIFFLVTLTIISLAILLIGIPGIAQFLPSQQSYGKVTVASAPVTVIRAGQEMTVGSFGLMLKKDDIIVTGTTGKAKVDLSTGDQIYIATSTRLELNEEPEKEKKSAVKKIMLKAIGKIRALVKKAQNRRFAIRTANAVIGVKGTEFIVEYKDETTSVATLDGMVNLESEKTQKSIDIPPGKMSSIPVNGEVMPLSEISGELLQGWEFAGKKMEKQDFSGEKLKL